MKMIKKLTTIIAIILVTGTSLVGCNAGDSGMGAPGSKTVMSDVK